ncbi:MAG: choice-of-anchor J domain-containing protein [Sphingobacteriaceae bacterium]|nr:choice-of-anchor J domain-containing protein [Sphingobacteriaceae bacterium]
MKKQLQFITALLFITVSLIGQVNVTGGSSATYSTVNAAFAAINAVTHFGTIAIDITASTTEPTTPTPLMASGQGAANYTSIVLRPSATATISGAMVTGRGVLELDGADNVTINGDIPGGPIVRDLTIVNNAANTVASTATIRLIGRATLGLGATSNSILNCIIYGSTPGNDGISGSTITSSYGIYAGSNAAALTSGGTGNDYDDLVIRNNEIGRAYFGLYVGCPSTGTGDNIVVGSNIFGSNTAGLTLSSRGILLNGVTNSTVQLNDVFNLKVNTTVTNAGIEISGASSNSVTISRNRISEMTSTNTGGYGSYGISLAGGTNHLVVNNVIYDIITTNYSATSQTFNAFGIRLSSGTGHMIYYNSVNMFGSYSLGNTTAASAAFAVTSTGVTGLDIRNNIFNNKMTSTAATKKFMAVWFPSAYNFLNANLNNNAYTVTNDADHFVGKIGTTTGVGEYSNLPAWQVISQVNNPTNDANSVPPINALAPFVADNNLNIPLNSITGIESGAVLIPALGTNIDYNAAVRPLTGTNPNTNPDMGAYEFDGLAGVATDAGIQALVSPAIGGCYTASENLVVTIKNYGTASISNIPVTVTVSGAASQTTTSTYVGSIAAGATANFTVGTLNMLAVGVYSFDAATSLTGDLVVSNNAMTQTTRTVVPVVALPQAVSFTGFSGANLTTVFPNWYEAAGATTPVGNTSLWTSQTGLNGVGNITARVNLYTTNRNEWIVGPKFTATSASQVSFDAALTDWNSTTVSAIMGSDDMVRVMVSTDCGLTYSPIFTVSATNSLSTTFSNFAVSLSAYAGQDIIVAFLAQDGPVDDVEDYDFHLENINLYTASATDAGIAALTSPVPNGCYGASENLVVTIKNYGIAAISNVPVTVTVSGVASQTTNATYTGSIPVGGTVSFTVGTLNMLAAGVYSIDASTSLAGDVNLTNDAMAQTTRVVTPTVALPQTVDFTGFSGANLTTFFPNWIEASGAAIPTGTTSLWTSQTGLNGVGNITSRINLYTTTRNEWIVGPKFTATSASQISFDAALTDWNSTTLSAIMGSDDMVRVMVSTNCGLTYSPIFTVSATNSLSTTFSNFAISLSAYAGQDIIVAFLAQDGPVDDLEDYDFHLDNINLYSAVPVDVGAQVLVSPAVMGCYGASENMVVTIKNYGTGTVTSVPVTIVVSGATTQTTTGTYTGTIIGGGTANYTVGTVNMLAPGVYSFKAYTSLSSDLNFANDTMAVATRTTVAPVALPQTVDFTGFTGANLTTVFPNWYEAAGATAPTGTTSLWVNQTGVPTTGNITARINLYTTSRNEWIVGPKLSITAGAQLSFDAAVTDWNSTTVSAMMGSDDKVRVMVSTDCGLTYSPIYTVSAANNLTTSFTNFTIPLGAYAGQDIILAFLAQDGPVDDIEDYDFHLDNINLYVGSATDAGVSALAAPTATACFTAAENVVVDITNYGVGAISNIPVTVNIAGPITQTVNGTYTGTIAVGATVTFTVGTANLSTAGIYTFSSVTSLVGDANTFNDGNSSTRTVTPLFSVSGNPNVCSGNSATITATGSATTYSWNTSATTSSIVVSPSVTTIYTVTGSNATCSLVLTQTLAVINPTITGTGTMVCAPSGTGTLTANGFSTVNWYSSPTSTVSLSTGNTYVPPSATITTNYYAEAQSSATGSIQTLFTGGNGCGGGNMFDITPTSGAIQLDSLHVNTSAALSSTFTVMLYYKTGGYLGNETNATAWTAWDTITVVSAGAGNPSSVVLASPLFLPPSLHALYVSYPANYTNGTNAYTNTDLTVQTGAGLCSNFGGVNAGRMFNGDLFYTKPGCTSPRIQVTLTVSVCTGIESIAANSNGVVVYPNPATEEVTVFVTSISKNTKLEVYNALGQKVISRKLDDAETKINVSELANGVYIYKIADNETVIKQGKLIKE